MTRPKIVPVLSTVLLACGCANLTVTNTTLHPDAKGIRYSLPQPILQAVPQADGTISVDVLHLPDSSHTYAIAADSQASTYTYQISISQSGLLNAIEFKEDTSAVGQQLAATAGAATAQYLNIQNAQLVAVQSAVNTAQTAVDNAKAAADAAAAQLQADTTNGVAAKLNDDKATLAQAQAKLQDAQSVLDRAKNNALAVTATASAGTPITTTGPSPGTTGFGAQSWQAPTPYDLPSPLGAVIYTINDEFDKATMKETVSLVAQKFPGYTTGAGNVGESTQQAYPTTTVALGQPTLGPQGLTYPIAAGAAKFIFNREVKSISASSVVGGDGKDTGSAIASLDATDHKTLAQDVSRLKAGSFTLTVLFIDELDKPRTATVKFTLN